MTGLVQVTPPSSEPVTTAEAKAYLRVDASADDALIDLLIKAAREWVESFLGRRLIQSTWDLKLDGFPPSDATPITLPYAAPAQSVTSIAYVDEAGATQTWNSANYTLDSAAQPALIWPAYTVSWPSTRAVPNAVTLRYVAGVASAAALDESVKLGVKLVLADLYENRGLVESNPGMTAARRLLWPRRLMTLA